MRTSSHSRMNPPPLMAYLPLPAILIPIIVDLNINSNCTMQGHRLKLVQQFCHIIDPKSNAVVAARHPVEPLSHSGFEFLHKPFDTAEVRVECGGGEGGARAAPHGAPEPLRV